MKKIDFILAGFPKSATTSIATILSSHPSICFSAPKEPDFFLQHDPGLFESETYRKCFSAYREGQLLGEGSQRYTIRDRWPDASSNIKRALPDCKLIFVARHPIARLISHYNMLDRDEDLTYSINEIFDQRRLIYNCLNTSKYYYQLEPYLERFDLKNIKIAFYEDFVASEDAVIADMLQFIDPSLAERRALDQLEKNVRVNTAEQENRSSRLYRTLNKLGPYNLLKRIVPLEFRDKYRKYLKVRFRDKSRLEPSIEARLKDALRDDVAKFLKLAGKPEDYWGLDSKP